MDLTGPPALPGGTSLILMCGVCLYTACFMFSAWWWFFPHRYTYCPFHVAADFKAQACLFPTLQLKLCKDVLSF
jgi:hypothetical protein